MIGRLIVLVAVLAGVVSCGERQAPLGEYTRYNAGERQNLPGEAVEFLKKTRFVKGELDGLPVYAVLFHGDPVKYFGAMGVVEGEVTMLDLGVTDVSWLYVVRPREKGRAAFMVNRAEPGAGGTTTQAAELAALGAKYVVHVGTSGLLGEVFDEKTVVVSTGSYKDGGAAMLAREGTGRVSRPVGGLSHRIETKMREAGVRWGKAVGYTIPIYYYQSEGLVRALLTGKEFAAPRPGYMEMEEAPFFEVARLAGFEAASLTVGADRYFVDRAGTLRHVFLEDRDVTESMGGAMRVVRGVFDGMASEGTTRPGETAMTR